MTSFAFPPVMAADHFDPYSASDAYSSYPTASQPYPPDSTYLDASFPAALTSIDSYSSVHAYAEAPRSQDPFAFGLESSQDFKAPHAPHHPYSPAASPAEHMPPPRLSSSSESGASVHSTSSSAMGSPHLHPQYNTAEHWSTMMPTQGLGLGPVVAQEPFSQEIFFTTSMDHEAINATIANDKLPGFVDPSIIHPHTFPSPIPYTHYPELPAPSPQLFEQPPSPAPSNHSQHGKVKASPNQSPYLRSHQYHPYSIPQRRMSTTSLHSAQSSQRSTSFEIDDETREKGMCPIPDCGRVFKDLKAHMLTHQNERPEKCPIQTCEYHTKGFARKYDKNRHTLTHYKGTMVCGFCPGSGSAAEKSFNRADVFKRHLTSVHGVEQNPPNSRKKSPSSKKGYSSAANSTTAGTCSTCNVTFANAQDFYEHLDDCVLRVVQQIDPSEAINQKHLTAISETKEVKETLERNGLSNETNYCAPDYSEGDEEEEEEEEIDNDDANDTTYGARNSRSGKGSMKSKQKTSGFQSTPHSGISNNRVTKASTSSRGRTGLTWSKGGVALHGPIVSAANGRKKRKNYPASWGCSTDKMRMKKRVLCVYDGPRRLWKDDMMLDQEFEVRVKLPGAADSRSYVTDLDVQTLKRAEAIHAATEEERGPWRPDNILDLSPVEGFPMAM